MLANSQSEEEQFTHVLPVTPKQMAYARSIAMRNGVTVPWEVQLERKTLSEWIERQLANPPEPNPRPTSKQVAFAEKLARIKRTRVPSECFASRDLMSRWITANK